MTLFDFISAHPYWSLIYLLIIAGVVERFAH
ncbi:UNVERIFIED_ORG: hypothetical protein M2414_000043 [Rahnella aquatilis]